MFIVDAGGPCIHYDVGNGSQTGRANGAKCYLGAISQSWKESLRARGRYLQARGAGEALGQSSPVAL